MLGAIAIFRCVYAVILNMIFYYCYYHERLLFCYMLYLFLIFCCVTDYVFVGCWPSTSCVDCDRIGNRIFYFCHSNFSSFDLFILHLGREHVV